MFAITLMIKLACNILKYVCAEFTSYMRHRLRLGESAVKFQSVPKLLFN